MIEAASLADSISRLPNPSDVPCSSITLILQEPAPDLAEKDELATTTLQTITFIKQKLNGVDVWVFSSIKPANKTKQPEVDDEYNIGPILQEYNAIQALSRVSAKFDSFCRAYMQTRKSAKKAAYVEMNCALMSIAIECRGDNDKLKAEIDELIRVQQKHIGSNVHD